METTMASAGRVTGTFLAAALLFALLSAVQTQGGGMADHVPAWRPATEEGAALPADAVGIPVRHCGSCRCCSDSNPGQCVDMTCCKEVICTPIDGCLPPKPIHCGCDPKTCV